MIRITQLKLPLDYAKKSLRYYAARELRLPESAIVDVRLFRKSVDARDKAHVHFILTLDVDVSKMPSVLPRNAEILPEPEKRLLPKPRAMAHRPLVVGLGPAGLFAALTLARQGLRPLVIERGRPVDQRADDVARFWRTGVLDTASNVQFGEGGAGAFSDGKLTTGIKDARCSEVLQTLYKAGAPEEILYAAKPHIGTDRLRGVVKHIREEIMSLGGEVRFGCRLVRILTENGQVVGAECEDASGTWQTETRDILLAVGHSARDTFEMLKKLGVPMEQKPFSIGVRIEHSQKMINRSQYGASAEHPALGAADYKLSERMKDGRGVYTFCMCPGGQVVASSSEAGGVVTNGMSLYARDGENANSAVLVSVGPGDFGSDDPLAGVAFQRVWERAAYRLGGENYRAPAQLAGDFLKGQKSSGAGNVAPSYQPGVTWTDLSYCLPDFAASALRMALPVFDRRIKGFAGADAVLTGVESRSSSPVRILRDEFCRSSLKGLYPCGEGAGYAGGILSAAVDGMRCAEALMAEE